MAPPGTARRDPSDQNLDNALISSSPDQIEVTPSVTPAPPIAGSATKNAPDMNDALHRHILPVMKQVATNIASDQITLAAAGCAFYATLSLFPAMSTMISLYGLLFDPQTVEPQLVVLRNLLPPAAYDLICDRIHILVAQSHSSLTLNLIVSTTIAMWSASAATRSLLLAMNVAYNTPETRSFLRFQAMGMIMTLCAICGGILTLALMVALPILLDYLPQKLSLAPPPGSLELLVRMGGPALMVLFVLSGCSLLYRFGPNRQSTSWRCILPGSVAATLLWLLTSFGFSYYVSHVAGYGATYGPLGAFVATMMWFYVSAYVVLLGAELNAGLEIQMCLRDNGPQMEGWSIARKSTRNNATADAHATPAKRPPPGEAP